MRKLLAGMMVAGALGVAVAAQAQSGAFEGETPVMFTLKKSLSTRNAKVGDPVLAIVETPATVNGTPLPRGSVLTGHVVEVTPHTKAAPASSVAVVFESLEPKKGTAFPVRATVFQIAQSDGQMEAGRSEKDLGGMRGQPSSNAQVEANSAHDAMSRLVSSHVSGSGPVQVISRVPDVALAAAGGNEKSGILSSTKQDVDLVNGTIMIIGVQAK